MKVDDKYPVYFVKMSAMFPGLKSDSATRIPPSDLTGRNAKSIVLGGGREERHVYDGLFRREASPETINSFSRRSTIDDLGAARTIEILTTFAGDNDR